jgi:acyl dehydratase
MGGELPEGGPYFDDLTVGQRIDTAPALTLTSGHGALHQAIVGDRLRLALDAGLSAAVTGCDMPLAHPALVWDVAIGQSTLVTRRVIANLFYRGLLFRRAPVIGDTLCTSTEVVALRENARRPGRHPTGMAVLRICTSDQEQRPVLDFWRCAMLPLSADGIHTGHADDFDEIPRRLDSSALPAAVAAWDLDRFATSIRGFAAPTELAAGRVWTVPGGDVVSSAPELARLTLNVATAHHDQGERGHRLVYGGHTIGVAASQLSRALPDLVTIVGWHGCDHTGPVHEADTLTSQIELERHEPLAGGGALLHLRSRVQATRAGAVVPEPVLDWRPVAVVAGPRSCRLPDNTRER